MANGIQVPSTKNYMIDRNGTVYAYIEALDVAVESEMLIVLTIDEQKVHLETHNVYKLKSISYEDVMNILR